MPAGVYDRREGRFPLLNVCFKISCRDEMKDTLSTLVSSRGDGQRDHRGAQRRASLQGQGRKALSGACSAEQTRRQQADGTSLPA